jgi:hypothetical protein
MIAKVVKVLVKDFVLGVVFGEALFLLLLLLLLAE